MPGSSCGQHSGKLIREVLPGVGGSGVGVEAFMFIISSHHLPLASVCDITSLLITFAPCAITTALCHPVLV